MCALNWVSEYVRVCVEGCWLADLMLYAGHALRSLICFNFL